MVRAVEAASRKTDPAEGSQTPVRALPAAVTDLPLYLLAAVTRHHLAGFFIPNELNGAGPRPVRVPLVPFLDGLDAIRLLLARFEAIAALNVRKRLVEASRPVKGLVDHQGFGLDFAEAIENVRKRRSKPIVLGEQLRSFGRETVLSGGLARRQGVRSLTLHLLSMRGFKGGNRVTRQFGGAPSGSGIVVDRLQGSLILSVERSRPPRLGRRLSRLGFRERGFAGNDLGGDGGGRTGTAAEQFVEQVHDCASAVSEEAALAISA